MCGWAFCTLSSKMSVKFELVEAIQCYKKFNCLDVKSL